MAKRRALGKGGPPDCVQRWADSLPNPRLGDAAAPPPVVDWTRRTIDDPGWPTSIE